MAASTSKNTIVDRNLENNVDLNEFESYIDEDEALASLVDLFLSDDEFVVDFDNDDDDEDHHNRSFDGETDSETPITHTHHVTHDSDSHDSVSRLDMLLDSASASHIDSQ